MQQEHIERFIMLASLEMPNLIVSTLFQVSSYQNPQHP